jgi:2-polyprenyl-3-methyl-5-hydroxy-6-metoxy-1,4-benzoquinol methylase
MSNPTNFQENDIRPQQMMADKQQCVEADRQFLLARRHEWVIISCPACGTVNSKVMGEKFGFTYVICTQCDTVYTNPRPSQELLHQFYTVSQNYEYWNRYIFPATELVRREKIFRPRADRLLKYCQQLNTKHHTLLEVGAAFGIFCEEILRIGYFEQVIALEPSPDLAQTCRNKGLQVIELPIEKVTENEIADVIAAFEVIEHLFSPRNFIQQCFRLLRPQGLLILSCPNVWGFDIATLGTISNTFAHEHFNYFHTKSLPSLLESCNFEVIDIQTPGKLDAELVRKYVLEGQFNLESQPFLRQILLDDWEKLGEAFQSFLSTHGLSSHMWVVGRKL